MNGGSSTDDGAEPWLEVFSKSPLRSSSDEEMDSVVRFRPDMIAE